MGHVMQSIERKASEFSSICQQLGYRKRKVQVVAAESVTLQDLNWSGGTRNTYHAYDIGSGDLLTASHLSVPHPMNNEHEGSKVSLRPGTAIIRTGHFCGSESVMTIYVHPSNMPASIEERVI